MLVPFAMVTLSSVVFPCLSECLDAEPRPHSAHAACPNTPAALWAAALDQGQGEPQAAVHCAGLPASYC